MSALATGNTSSIGPSPDRRAIAFSHRVLADKSKSFALAAKLLPASSRDEIAVIYAFCRYVDDAIDLVPADRRVAALATLRGDIDALYDGRLTGNATLDAFASIVKARALPRPYVDALVDGMAMDVDRVTYSTSDTLYLYGYRVAGVVGLLLCHVMGLRDARALRNAAHLGIAMQLTNICRDVDEDLRDGRVYLPHDILLCDLASTPEVDAPERTLVRRAVHALLDDADRFYRSADRGLWALPFRSALAVRAARYVYAAIGTEIRKRQCDPFLGRVSVPTARKFVLIARALVVTILEQPIAMVRANRAPVSTPNRLLTFPIDVLPVDLSEGA